MAKLEIILEGQDKGVAKAFSQVDNAVASATSKINKNLKASRSEIDAWDAAARKASQSRYAGGINPEMAERTAASMKRLRDAQSQLQTSTANYTRTQGSANGVAIEFSRIIQDAPYGIQGVANNIQQLTQSMAYSAQASGGLGAALSASFSSLISPMNLVVLGISAVTAGWTLYTNWSRKAKKETDDVAKSLDDITKSLGAVRSAMAAGEADAYKQSTQLKVLYDATQDTTLSLDKRGKAVKALQKQFPSYFGNLKTEAILSGQAKGAYDTLATAIVATAQARAAADKIAAGSLEQLKNRTLIEQEQLLLNQANERVQQAKERLDLLKRETTSFSAVASQRVAVANAEKERDLIADSINEKAIANNAISQENNRLYKEISSQIKAGADATLTFSDNVETVNTKSKEVQKTWKEIYDNISNISFKNALDDLDKVKSQLNKIYGDQFDPFDLSKTWRRPEQETDKSTGVSYLKKAQEEWAEDAEKSTNELSKTMSRAIDRAGRDFYRTLTNLGTMTDGTLAGIFSTITDGINESMQEVFLGNMSDLLKKGIKDGTDGLSGALSSQLGIALSAIGLAGGIISGLGSPDRPNYGAKVAGGALQGAAAGAMAGSVLPGIGTLVGGLVGGLVGAVGGLFGAKKRERELRLQEEQLKEQQKQTKLLERQNALSYMSSVVGRYVQGQGVLSSLDFTATGQLTARIDGKDIVLSYDRTKKDEGRGV